MAWLDPEETPAVTYWQQSKTPSGERPVSKPNQAKGETSRGHKTDTFSFWSFRAKGEGVWWYCIIALQGSAHRSPSAVLGHESTNMSDGSV